MQAPRHLDFLSKAMQWARVIPGLIHNHCLFLPEARKTN